MLFFCSLLLENVNIFTSKAHYLKHKLSLLISLKWFVPIDFPNPLSFPEKKLYYLIIAFIVAKNDQANLKKGCRLNDCNPLLQVWKSNTRKILEKFNVANKCLLSYLYLPRLQVLCRTCQKCETVQRIKTKWEITNPNTVINFVSSQHHFIMLEKNNNTFNQFVDVFTIYNGTFLSSSTDTAAAKIIMPIRAKSQYPSFV